MTIRELAATAEKNGFLDARIVIHTKSGIHDVEQCCLAPEYHANTPEGRVVIKNVAFIDYKSKPLRFVDRGSEDGYLELED